MVKNNRIVPLVYLAPALILLSLFVYYPMLKNIGYSFFEWSPFSSEKKFIAIANYVQIFKDPVFYTALKNNLVYAAISFLLQVVGGLILAAVLEDRIFRRFSALLRTVYFLPVLISMTVIGIMFSFIYNPDVGLLNQFLRMIGLEQFAKGWLGDSETAIYAVIAVSQWQSIGYTVMLFVLAIQKVPNELYEAATIDGASKIQSFIHITVPQVKEMISVLTIYTITGSFLVFSEIYVLTNGGPGYSSQVFSTYLYQKAFIDNESGAASAIANIILVITLLFYFLQGKVFKTGKE